MNVGGKRKKEIQFRYYEIPQDEPCLALLGEAWVRPYGDGIDCLHFHNYMEIGFCYGMRQVRLQLFPKIILITRAVRILRHAAGNIFL